MNNTWEFALFFLGEVVIFAVLFGTWLYFLLHGVRHLQNDLTRVRWVVWFVVFFIFAVPIYYFMVYRHLHRAGKGGLCVRPGEYNDVEDVQRTG